MALGRTGFDAMQQAVKNVNTPRGGGGRRFNYFGLEDGESMIVRFITDVDEILTCDFYEFVQCADGKNSFIVAPDLYANDPEWKGEDWVLKYGGQTQDYNTKEMGPPKPKERTVAIAVEREAVPVESSGGRPKFKYQDKIVDITVKDKDSGAEKTFKGRNFMIIRKDAKTFWGGIVGYYGEFGTLSDRDYKITRNGKQLATTFNTIPVGPAEEWDDIDEFRKLLHARYGYGTGLDEDGKEIGPDSPDRFLYVPMTLQKWAEDQASEERAKSLLLGGNGQAKAAAATRHDNDGWASNSNDEPQAAPPPAAGDVSALRQRLQSHT